MKLFEEIDLNKSTKETIEYIKWENDYLSFFKKLSKDGRYRSRICLITFDEINSSKNNPKEKYTEQNFINLWTKISTECKETENYLTSLEIKNSMFINSLFEYYNFCDKDGYYRLLRE